MKRYKIVYTVKGSVAWVNVSKRFMLLWFIPIWICPFGEYESQPTTLEDAIKWVENDRPEEVKKVIFF